MHIRLLKQNDIPEILHIIRTNWGISTAQTAHVEFQQAFTNAMWKPTFYVAIIDDKIVGTACYCASWMAWGCYDIAWVNTHIDFRNMGIGISLVEKCIDDIRAVGNLVMLNTKIPEYYNKHWGFIPMFEYSGECYMRLELV
jgi:predicted N-acetyltransferase YhbS